METKKLIILALLVFSFINLAAASIDVNFTFYEGTQYANGTKVVNVSSAINGVQLETYPCLNTACTTVGAKITSMSTTATGSNMIITFPTESLSVYGYLVYFSHADYFGAEDVLNISGTRSTAVKSSVFLYKREGGNIPVDTFTVPAITKRTTNEVFNITISHLERNGAVFKNDQKANNTLSETIDTNITFNVYDSSNTLVYSSSQIKQVAYGTNTQVVSFNYAFPTTGNFTVEAKTQIIDNQLFGTTTITQTKPVKVISEITNNYSYSTVTTSGNLTVKKGVAYSLATTHSSFYVNEYGTHIASNSIINTTIRNNEDASVLYTNTTTQAAGSYVFEYIFNKVGEYTITTNVCSETQPGTLTCSSKTNTVTVTGKTTSDSSKDTKKISALTNIVDSSNNGSKSNIIELTSEKTTETSETKFPVEEVAVTTISIGIALLLIKIILLCL